MPEMSSWTYDERTGMVAVYSGPEMNCLDVPSDSFIYVRHWKHKVDGTIGYDQVEEDKKVGRLVAAAPELLAALKDCMAQISSFDPGGCVKGTTCDRLGSARAAIAKAEGK